MTARVELTRSYELSALHVLQRPGLSQQENLALFGPCARPHGHDYNLQITVSGPIAEDTGELVDRRLLDETIERVLLEPFDGSHLNDHFSSTTGEALARDFFDLLQPELTTVELVRVTVVETAKNRFVYPAGSQGVRIQGPGAGTR